MTRNFSGIIDEYAIRFNGNVQGCGSIADALCQAYEVSRNLSLPVTVWDRDEDADEPDTFNRIAKVTAF